MWLTGRSVPYINLSWPMMRMIDTKTAVGADSGGGFGRTDQLDDGTLITSYSYRDADGETHCEVVRWAPPASADR